MNWKVSQDAEKKRKKERGTDKKILIFYTLFVKYHME